MSAARRPAIDIISHSPEQTRAFGAQLGRLLGPGDVVLLSGDLGAGKTTFIQGLARGLGIAGPVQSPTFTIVSEHHATGAGATPLFHIDLYRLQGARDTDSFGFDEYLNGDLAVVALEWPERAPTSMPEEHVLVELRAMADTKRRVQLLPRGSRYAALLERFRVEVAGARG